MIPHFHFSDFHILRIFADCGHVPLLYPFNYPISKPSFVCFSRLIALLERYYFLSLPPPLWQLENLCWKAEKQKKYNVSGKVQLQICEHRCDFKPGVFSYWSLFSIFLVGDWLLKMPVKSIGIAQYETLLNVRSFCLWLKQGFGIHLNVPDFLKLKH